MGLFGKGGSKPGEDPLALMQAGDYKKAIKVLEQRIKADPHDRTSKRRLAEAYEGAGRPKEAAPIYIAEGEALLSSGDRPKGLAFLKKAAKIVPDDKALASRIAELEGRGAASGDNFSFDVSMDEEATADAPAPALETAPAAAEEEVGFAMPEASAPVAAAEPPAPPEPEPPPPPPPPVVVATPAPKVEPPPPPPKVEPPPPPPPPVVVAPPPPKVEPPPVAPPAPPPPPPVERVPEPEPLPAIEELPVPEELPPPVEELPVEELQELPVAEELPVPEELPAPVEEPATRPAESDEVGLMLGAFPGLDAMDVMELIACFGCMTLQPGEVLIREGEAGEAVYLVIRGQLRARASLAGEEVELATLTRGDVLGEVSFMHNVPRTATVTALESTVVLEMPGASAKEQLAAMPHIKERLEKLIEERVERTLALVKERLKAHPGA